MNQLKLQAPALEVSHWLNCDAPLSIAGLRGKVVVLYAFQMLCPGCVTHGLPQATAIHTLYRSQPVQVIGLHTVLEHHAVMTRDALAAFVHEYRLPFPIAIDQPGEHSAEPITMQKYALAGTPSLVLIDKQGYIRVKHFGRLSDMEVGNLIGTLVQEDVSSMRAGTSHSEQGLMLRPGCDDSGCALR